MPNPPKPAKPPRRQMNVRLPVPLLDRIDERRALRGLSREAFVERAIEFALDHSRPNLPTTTAPGKRTAPR